MNANLAGALFLAALLGGCSRTPSDEVAGGGFETSDLQVALTDSTGTALVGARVWLVQKSEDSSAPSLVLDSANTDETGKVAFRIPTGRFDSVGLEAWQGDTLVAFLPQLDSSARRPFSVPLRRPRVLTLPCAPYRQESLILPGSHFRQEPPSSCEDSFFVLLPPGDWRLFAVNSWGASPRDPLPVRGDSLSPWYPPPRTGDRPSGPYPPPYDPKRH